MATKLVSTAPSPEDKPSAASRLLKAAGSGIKGTLGAFGEATLKTARLARKVVMLPVTVPARTVGFVSRQGLYATAKTVKWIYGKKSLEGTIAKSAEKALKKWIQENIAAYMGSLRASPEEQRFCSKLIDQCLERSVPSLIATFFSQIPIHEITDIILSGAREHGISPSITLTLSSYLKQRYASYIAQFDTTDREKLEQIEIILHQFIDTFTEAISKRNLLNIRSFLSDSEALSQLFNKALAQTTLTKEDGKTIDVEQSLSLVHLVAPDLDQRLIEILEATKFTSPEETASALTLICSMGFMKQQHSSAASAEGSDEAEYERDLSFSLFQSKLKELEPFFNKIHKLGFARAVKVQSKRPHGKGKILFYLQHVAALFNIKLLEADFNFLFKRHGISSQGKAFLKSIEIQSGENSILTQLIMLLSTLPSRVLSPHANSILTETIDEMSALDADKQACLTSTQNFLTGAMPPVVGILLSKLPIQSMLPKILRQIKTTGLDLSSASPVIANALKNSYNDYIESLPSPASDIKHKEAAKAIIYQIIDTLSQTISRQSWMSLPDFLKDQDQLIAIIKEAIANSTLIDSEGRLDGDRLVTFLDLAIPDLEQTIEELLVAGLPQTQAMTQDLLTSALVFGGMQGARDEPYMMDFARATTTSIAPFLKDLYNRGIYQSLVERIEAGQIEPIKVYLCQVANLFGVELTPGDLSVFFTENTLSEVGKQLLKNLDTNCSKKPLIDQLTYAVATFLSQTGHLDPTLIDSAVQHLKAYGIKALATISKQSAVKPFAELFATGVKPTPATPKPLLSKSLADVVKVLDTPMQTTTSRIKASLETITPWIIYSNMIKALGREDLANESFFLDYILPKVSKDKSMFIQAFEISDFLSVFLKSSSKTSLANSFKSLGLAFSFTTLDVLSSMLSFQMTSSLHFVSERLQGAEIMRETMRLSLNAITNLRTAAQTLQNEGVEQGSEQWNERMKAEIEQEKVRVVMALANGIKQEIKSYPKNKFKYALSILKNPQIPKKSRVLLFLKELFCVLMSPIFIIFALILLPRNEQSIHGHVLHSVISSVFEQLDIEDNNNLLSTVVETTNEVLRDQVDTLLINNSDPGEEVEHDTEMDVELLRFATSAANESSQFNNTLPLGKFLARLQTNLHGVASITRDNILKNLTAKKWKSYFASGLEAFAPSPVVKDAVETPYEEKVKKMGTLVAEVSIAGMRAQMKTLPKNRSQACYLVAESFINKRTELEQITDEIKVAMQQNREKSDKLMKKALIHMTVFIQDLERYSPYLNGTDEFEELNALFQSYKHQLRYLSEQYTKWREAKDDDMRFMYSLEFQNGISRWMDPEQLNSTQRVLETMYDRYNEALDAPTLFKPMMGEKVRKVAKVFIPGFVSKTTQDLSKLVSCISVH